jgi:hypothetical protein
MFSGQESKKALSFGVATEEGEHRYFGAINDLIAHVAIPPSPFHMHVLYTPIPQARIPKYHWFCLQLKTHDL